MAGCNCKSDSKNDGEINGEKVKLNKSILNYSVRFIFFLFSLVLLPIVVIGSIWILFNTLVLTKGVNIMDVLKAISKKLKTNTDDDDDDDDEYYNNYNSDEYEMLDVEVITNDIK